MANFASTLANRQMALDKALDRLDKAESSRQKAGVLALNTRSYGELGRAMERTAENAAFSQRAIIRNFVRATQTRRKDKIAEPIGIFQLWPPSMRNATTIKMAYPKILDYGKGQIFKQGVIASAQSEAQSSAQALKFIATVYREAAKRAEILPAVNPKYVRTYAHYHSFMLGWGRPGGAIRAIELVEGISPDSLERRLGEEEMAPDTLLYIFNTVEYASSLEAYFDHIGKGGILYGAFNQYVSQVPAGIAMKYTYIHPSNLVQSSYSGIARTRKSGATYDYNMPAIAFGSLANLMGQPSSKPGYKLGKTGRLSKNRNGRFS